jgi:hypothetical protein
MAPFKQSDTETGQRRRRIDFDTVRYILENVIYDCPEDKNAHFGTLFDIA